MPWEEFDLLSAALFVDKAIPSRSRIASIFGARPCRVRRIAGRAARSESWHGWYNGSAEHGLVHSPWLNPVLTRPSPRLPHWRPSFASFVSLVMLRRAARALRLGKEKYYVGKDLEGMSDRR